MLPKDPVILLSVLNTYLRDKYSSLSALCEDLGVEKSEIDEKMTAIDYVYDEKQNRFV